MNRCFASLAVVVLLGAASARADDAPVRIASGVAGHIHPAICKTKQGTLVGIFGQSDFKDLRVTRSTDGGKTWSEPVPFKPAAGEWLYPGSLTTLADGRIVHLWNRWYGTERTEPRHVVYSISTDDGVTWSDAKELPKSDGAVRVARHPLLELGPDAWLVSCSDAAMIFHPSTGRAEPFADGRTDPPSRTRPVVPILKTPRGTLVSGRGLRSTDAGKTWTKIEAMPDIHSQGWRHDMAVLANGWLLASAVDNPDKGGNVFSYVVSYDDGVTWTKQVEFLKPGRPIGGRACPRLVQVDDATLGILYYDVSTEQPGGPGVFFLRMPLEQFAAK